MATIQTNSVLPLTLNFPRLPSGVDPTVEDYLVGIQNTIQKLYNDVVKAIRVRAMVAAIAQEPAAGAAGRLFYASDTVALYVDDGHMWNLLARPGTHTLKRGTGSGNYTTTSATFVAIDATNLSITATIPVGSIGLLFATGTLLPASSGILIVGIGVDSTTTVTAAVAGGTAAISEEIPFAIHHATVGDGAAHTYTLNYNTSAGTGTVLNGSAGLAPAFDLVVMAGA